MNIELNVGPATPILMAYAATALMKNDYYHTCLALLALSVDMGQSLVVQVLQRFFARAADEERTALMVKCA